MKRRLPRTRRAGRVTRRASTVAELPLRLDTEASAEASWQLARLSASRPVTRDGTWPNSRQ